MVSSEKMFRMVWRVVERALPALAMAAVLPLCAHASGKDRGVKTGIPCLAIADAAQSVDRDICISAHIYDVVELADGTRFLDVCPPETVDEDCRFLIVSRNEDRDVVGELTKYRDHDVRIRGLVRRMHGRMGVVLSHARQFNGGPEKFRPDPRLVRGFSGQSDRRPVQDPNLRAVGGRRSFMNHRDTETLPAAKP